MKSKKSRRATKAELQQAYTDAIESVAKSIKRKKRAIKEKNGKTKKKTDTEK